jgi:hypothetical protein
MSRLKLKLALLVLVICVLGCTRYSVKEGSYQPVRIRDQKFPGSQILLNNVSLLDQEIANKVTVESTNARRTPTNTLESWAILRNRTDYPLQLEARASFYDVHQAPLEGPTAWQRLYLPPNATAHFKTSSTRTDVGYYQIEVKEGR